MAKTLVDAMLAIQDLVGDVEGIRSAPEYISDKIPPGVFAMSFLDGGIFKVAPSAVLQGLHNIGLYVACARVNLRTILPKLYPLGEKVAGVLENNPRLLETVSTFGPITYTFSYAINVGTDAAPAVIAGWVFTITEVKIEDTTILA